MKLNKHLIEIASYSSEKINEEKILYNEESQKIVTLNQTATFIWDLIIKNYELKNDITTNMITAAIIKKYNVDEVKINEIEKDIIETIELLFESSLIKKLGDEYNEEIL